MASPRCPRQGQSQHEMMDQMMQMTEELSNEKTAHKKVKHQLLCCIALLEETISCTERVEAASLGAIKMLKHLIFHNQNVDRALALNQQCLAKEKEAQATEMQDWKQRSVELTAHYDQLESLSWTIKNRMLLAKIDQLRNEKDNEISKTQTNKGEVQIQKLEKYVGNVQTELDHEKRELSAKLSHGNLFLEGSCHSQELEMKIAEVKATALAAINNKEKQQIMAQILSSQSELEKAMNVLHQQNEKNEELQQELKLDSEQQSSNVLENKNPEAMSTKLEMRSFEITEDTSQHNSNEMKIETTKIQESSKETNNDLEDCLATGMVKLQQEIDDFKKDITEKAEDEACKRKSDLKKLQEDQEKPKKI